MKGLLLLAGLALVGLSYADTKEHYGKRHKYQKWCEQNWAQCREFKLQKISIKEKFLAGKRDCLQKAKDYWSYKECVAPLKVRMKREITELRRKMKGQ